MGRWEWNVSGSGKRVIRGLWRRVWGSVALLVGGLLFVIAYLGFLAVHFPWYENLAVVLTTVVMAPVLVIALWATWAAGLARRACQGELTV